MKQKLTALLLVLLLAVTLVLPVMAAAPYVDDDAALLTLSEVETLEARAACSKTWVATNPLRLDASTCSVADAQRRSTSWSRISTGGPLRNADARAVPVLMREVGVDGLA